MKVICPKCKQKGTLIADKKSVQGTIKLYYKVKHYESKRKVRQCYLGKPPIKVVERVEKLSRPITIG